MNISGGLVAIIVLLGLSASPEGLVLVAGHAEDMVGHIEPLSPYPDAPASGDYIPPVVQRVARCYVFVCDGG